MRSLIARPPASKTSTPDGTAAYNASHYRLSPFYDLAKVAANRMAFAHAKDLAAYHATAISITPG